MNDYTKNRAIILAITEGGLTHTEAATRFNVTTRWIRTLIARYRTGGLDAVDPQSKRPHTNPNATDEATIATILTLRTRLIAEGLDAGPESIWDRLPAQTRPSTATIWRILRRNNTITDQPQKRPRSSWHRFEAAAPNETWQSDFTHWPLADGTDMKIISWLDDHSRKLLHATAYTEITGPIVIDTFIQTMDVHGPPASTLTDNGMVYTARFAGGAGGRNAQLNGFEQLIADMGIVQKNGAANHPTTQGKIERYHQTLKRWLTADGLVDTIEELDKQLARFGLIYNTERPHRAIGRRTPQAAYTATDKAFPVIETVKKIWRVRYDKIDAEGKVSLRYAGRLRHLGIGRAHARTRILLLVNGNETMVIDRSSGVIIAEHTIDTAKDYQTKKKPER
ncbi:integrase core domain-containing protein [Brevibacterium aurantiacum]|uniref:IS481 family transposase n=1 Tax=Brevibacterium aurantiacum TaxID=273384 RepID=A0A2A3Z1X0_BREAU|nr:integrase core domain-containing protein [Brevibacterium aurantiacum]PCC45518.1 IS481 family transposase [Brevibacterium aurantiacum]